MNERVHVSILIPCYNAERWIEGAIRSALEQTWPDLEVIVVDDGSTDRSLEIIKKFAGRIRWESGPNRGGNAARNRLLELAKGNWLQYLDADDELLPDKIANQALLVQQHGDFDLVFGPVTLEYVHETATERVELPIPEPHDPWMLLARWHLPQTGSPLWRREAVLDAGRWKEGQPCCQEHELYLRMLMTGKRFRYHEKGGSIYRQWSDKTVCNSNIPQVHRERLAIMQSAETFLFKHGGLTAERQRAFAEARFGMARMIWLYDRSLALALVRAIENSNPAFKPEGPSITAAYRKVYAWLGFATAERIAALLRSLRTLRGETLRVA